MPVRACRGSNSFQVLGLRKLAMALWAGQITGRCLAGVREGTASVLLSGS